MKTTSPPQAGELPGPDVAPEGAASALVDGLADRLRVATKSAHIASERAAMQNLFHPSVLTRPRYGNYLLGLYHVYHTLEAQLERHRDHPAIAPLRFPELRRTQAVAEDLVTLVGPSWPQQPTPAAAQRYVDHLHLIGGHEPVLLVAHIYTRYLGDLYGGQLLKSQIERQLKLSPDQGVRSLLFQQIPDLPKFRDEFRHRINALALSNGVVEQIVTEAIHAFALTQAMFESLSASG